MTTKQGRPIYSLLASTEVRPIRRTTKAVTNPEQIEVLFSATRVRLSWT